jgi:hypothetical protein
MKVLEELLNILKILMVSESKYDWIVVGGGVSGITISEILTREGNSVLLLEKNEKLASETSKDFHEWVHSGALYTLIPDKLLTLRYLLGATDDLIEYYSCFPRMNMAPTDSGIKVTDNGWFNNEMIEFRYKSHKFNPLWLCTVSRSTAIIDLIKQHDWLRRRAGSEYGSSKVKFSDNFVNIKKQLLNNDTFFSVESPDFTMNSRNLLSDILMASEKNGIDIQTNSEVEYIKDSNSFVEVGVNDKVYKSEKIVITSPDAISKFNSIPIKKGFAPMAIVKNVPTEEKSFVELDYYPSKCINLLKKQNGIGQAGGITLNNENKINDYLKYVFSEHQKRNPSIKLIDTYVGLKKELVNQGQQRNYLYHINQNSSNVWSVVLGKFTLAFSMAPEFYRRIYNKNPSKLVKFEGKNNQHEYLSDTTWQEIAKINRS